MMLENSFQCPNPLSGWIMDNEQAKSIAERAGELAKLARVSGLEFLSYLLEIAAQEAAGQQNRAVSPQTPSAFADSDYLRGQAARCMRLARDYQRSPVSHDLEAIGVELMQKAGELDQYLSSRKRTDVPG
jgi:hypothetical protein